MTTTAVRASAAPTSADRTRQVAVTAAEVFCVVGSLVGAGVLGTSVEDTNSGALSADSTFVAPAGPAFSIWSVIYAGLLAYTVWQWLPSRAADPRLRATGWLAALSMVLNATWLLVTQQDWIWASVVVIVALLATLVEIARRLGVHDAHEPQVLADRVVVDGTFGLYLGWVAVATAANVVAALTSSGTDVGVVGAVVAIAVVVGGLAFLFSRIGGRLGVLLAAAWGLMWVVNGRLVDQPRSTVVAGVALVGAVVVLAAAVAFRRPPSSTPARTR